LSGPSARVGGKALDRNEGVGVVVAEDPAAGESVLVELASGVVLAQPRQVAGEVVGCAQGVGIVIP